MRKAALLFLIACATLAHGQNGRYDSVALGPKGPIPKATIAVCTQPANTGTQPCSPLAAFGSGGKLCASPSDTVCSSPNPLTADALGNYSFYAPPASGPYTVQIYGTQVSAPLALADQGPYIIPGSNITFSKHNNVVWVDDVRYTTLAGAQADVQCFGGSVNTNCADYINSNHNETFTSAISLGNSGNSAFQHIHGMPGVHLNCNVGAGGNCFTLNGGSAISGEQTGESGNTSGGMLITYPSTANVACVFCVPAQNGGQSYINLHDLFVAGNASATVGAVADLVSVNNQPVLNNLYFSNFPSVGMQVRTVSNTGAVAGPFIFVNDWMDGSANTNAQPWAFTPSGNTMLGVNIQSGVANHPGSGKTIMLFNGNKAVANSALFAVKVSGTYFENLVNGSSIGVKLADVESANVDSVPMALQNTDTAVDISQSAAGRTCNVTIQNLHVTSPSNGHSSINNHISGFTASGFTNVPFYNYGADSNSSGCGSGTLPFTVDSNEVDFFDRANHLTYRFTVGGNPVFRNFTDAAHTLTIDSGATAAQAANIDFNDRNTLQWQIGKIANANFAIQDTANSFKQHITLTQTAATPEVAVWRLGGKNGTAETTGQVGTLSAGWGTTATVSAASGNDTDWSFTISSTGTGQAANPTAVFTFKDGAWVNSPICGATRADVNSPAAATWTLTAPSTTTVTLNFIGTPVAATTYTINGHCGAR